MQWSRILKSARNGFYPSIHGHENCQLNTKKFIHQHFPENDCWTDHLREVYDTDLVAFCAGNAPFKNRAAAHGAVYFPLMNGLLYTMPIPDHPTPNRAICFAAKEALVIANTLDPSGKKKLIINTRYQGLVHSMASHRGKARWVDRWQQNQWRKTNGQRVVNRDVIQVLVAAEMYRSQTMWHFIDKHNTPEWMMKLHQQTHEEAKRMARRFLEEK